jgi:phosphatidate cytidylyltransferase
VSGELGRRVAVAAVGIPAVMGALLLGGWVLGALVAGVAALAAREFYALAEAGGVQPFVLPGAGAAAALVLLATARPTPESLAPPAFALLVSLTLACLVGAIWLRWPQGGPLGAVSATVLGVLYTGATLAFVPVLRALPGGVETGVAPGALASMGFILLPLATTWAGDSAGYFAGRAWGQAKLAPAVSPGKTWVGAGAGLAGSTLAAVVLSLWILDRPAGPSLGPLAAALIGLALGAVAQVGDLVESVLKREAGVKDSGSLLPGHGGVLDRMDSLLFAIPATWGLLMLARVAQ